MTKHKTAQTATQTEASWEATGIREIDVSPRAGFLVAVDVIEIGLPIAPGKWKILAFVPANEPESEESSLLILAAPDMAKALHLWISGADMDEFDKAARAAYAKATGRPA